MTTNSSSSDGILGQRLFEGKTQTIYSVIDQSNLICIHQRDPDEATDTSNTPYTSTRRTSIDAGFRSSRSRSFSVAENPSSRGTWITSITASVYEILREASIPTYFIAPHPQSDMFIAQKCTMIPIIWFVRRLATESYVKHHPHVPLGHRFVPPLVELSSQRRPNIYRRLTLSNLEETILNSDRVNTIDEADANEKESSDDECQTSLYSSEQLSHLPWDFSSMKISVTDLEYMYEICLTVFDILEHVWMTEKKYQLIDLKLEFGLTSNKEIVIANVFDADTWHIFRSGSQDFIEENLCLIHQSLREILHFNACLSSTTKTLASNEMIENDPQSINLPSISSSVSTVSRCLIIASSVNDIEYGQKIKSILNETYNLICEIRLCSIQNINKILSQYAFEHCRATVILTLGQLNNGLAMFISSNSLYPVIHGFFLDSEKNHHLIDPNTFLSRDLSSVTLVFSMSSAVQNIVQILAMKDWRLWVKQRGRRWKKWTEFLLADQQLLHNQANKGTTGLSLNK